MGKALEWMGSAGCMAAALDMFENARALSSWVEADCPLTVHATPGKCFRYYPEEDRAHCFACDTTTDLIGCFNALHGRDLHDSDGFRVFRERYAAGVSVSERRAKTPKCEPDRYVPAPSVAPSELWQGQALKLARDAHAALLANPAGRFMVEASGRKSEVEMGALDWLREHRGIALSTVRRFGLGWIGKRVYKSRESWGLPPMAWDDGKPRALCIKRGLLIPTFGPPQASGGQREILRLRVRLESDETGPKYQLVDGSRNRPVVIAPRALAHVVEETELDGMLIAQEAGDLVGVVMVGAAKLRPQAAEHEAITASRCLLVAMDAGEEPSDWSTWLARTVLRRTRGLRVRDDAHDWVLAFARPRFRGAGAEAGDWWLATYPQAKRWPVPEGKDIGEFWSMGGDLRTWILAGLPSGIRFMIERRREKAGHEGSGCARPSSAPSSPPAPIPASEMREQSRPVSEPKAIHSSVHPEDFCASKSGISPAMLAGWRRARAWLMPRLDDLLAAGWTKPGLFRVGRGRYPWGWGIAWRGWWRDDRATVSLDPGGAIVITLHEAHGKTVQCARPHCHC